MICDTRRRAISLAIALFSATSSMALAADLRIGFSAEVTSADPHIHQAQNRNVWFHVYETLVKQDAQLRAVPGLARGWRATDAKTWVFTLRPNVTFHDGSPFEAEDVKASIERAKGLQGLRTLKGYLRDIESVTVTDPMTVQVKTTVPSPFTPDNLSLVPIISRKYASASEESFGQGQSSVGTGPYKLKEYVRGQKVVLVRNDKYWGSKEPWDNVTFEFLLKEPARASALLSGTVDVVNGATASLVEALQKNDKMAHIDTTSYMLNYLVLDQRPSAAFVTDASGKPFATNPLKNVKVRQAMSLAINRSLIASRVMKGDAVPSVQMVPAGFFGHEPAMAVPAGDVAKAKALLAEAGYPQGFNLTMHCPNDRYLNDAKVCEAIGQMFTQAGIKTDVQAMPFAVIQPWLVSAPKGKQEISVAMWGFGNVFGDSFQAFMALTRSFDSKTGAGVNNYGRGGTAAADELIDRANQTIAPSEREGFQRKLAQLVAEDVTVIPIQHLKASYAFRKGLSVTPRSDAFIYAMDVREAGAK